MNSIDQIDKRLRYSKLEILVRHLGNETTK